MRLYTRKSGYKKGNESNIPNIFALTLIKNFLTNNNYKEMRHEYFINDLNNKQVNQAIQDIKWLFKDYKDLDVVTIENSNGDIKKFIL
ncbi:MAG: hypothetical protein RR942_15970 [Romboutsia sp.]